MQNRACSDVDQGVVTELLEIWFCSNKEPDIAVLPLARLTRGPGPGNLAPGPKIQIPDPVVDYPTHLAVFPAKPEDAVDRTISCRECLKKFPFTVSEQTFYIQ